MISLLCFIKKTSPKSENIKPTKLGIIFRSKKATPTLNNDTKKTKKKNFISPSKVEAQSIVRKGLDLMIKEVG